MSIWQKMSDFLTGSQNSSISNTTQQQKPLPMSDFGKVLKEENITLNVAVKSRNELLKYLSNYSHQLDKNIDTQSVYGKFIVREQETTTELGNGLVMPHVQDPSVKHLMMLVVKLEQPISWTATSQIDTAIAFLIPDPEADYQHVSYLASVARLLLQKDFYKHLQHAKNSLQILELFVK